MTPTEIQRLFTYDAELGVLRWAVQRRGIQKGSVAGGHSDHGYYRVSVNGKQYKGARVIWAFHKGEWPQNEIDHIDRDISNDRIENLRDSTRKENMSNLGLRKTNSSGVANVTLTKRGQYFATKNRKSYGPFNSLALAKNVAESLNNV